MKHMLGGLFRFVLVTGFLLAGPMGAVAQPVELNIWSAFPELHDQVQWIANKYM